MDTLSIDIMGPLPADRRMEYIITLGDCFSKYAILIPSKDHTAQAASDALLDGVISYFRVPKQLLSNKGGEFNGQAWEELLKAPDIQSVLTSPYHPKGNSINKQSHRTMNNMLCAYLYFKGTPVPRWINKIPAIISPMGIWPL